MIGLFYKIQSTQTLYLTLTKSDFHHHCALFSRDLFCYIADSVSTRPLSILCLRKRDRYGDYAGLEKYRRIEFFQEEGIYAKGSQRQAGLANFGCLLRISVLVGGRWESSAIRIPFECSTTTTPPPSHPDTHV